MGRVINPITPGKERSQLLKALIIALDRYFSPEIEEPEKKDLTAFIILTLDAISKTVDTTTIAWEKRGYWIKADRFRLDWTWIEKFRLDLRSGVSKEDWHTTDMLIIDLFEVMKCEVEMPKRYRLGEPWHGANKKL